MAFRVLLLAALPALGKQIGGYSTTFLVLQEDGQVFGSGLNLAGELGIGVFSYTAPFPVAMDQVSFASDLCVGRSFSCVVDLGGRAKCAGSNTYGRLGDGTAERSPTLVQVSGLDAGVSEVFCGNQNACVVMAGAAKCWGYNAYGAIGNGTSLPTTRPLEVAGFARGGVRSVAIGENHICFLALNGGRVVCSGSNLLGQLGGGANSSEPQLVPREVDASLPAAVAVACGSGHTCVVTDGGQVLCFGHNAHGQLGLGGRESVYAPTQVVLGAAAKWVWAVAASTFVLLENGTAVAFGQNDLGALGSGSLNASSLVPVAFAQGAGEIAGITGGVATTCVALVNGTTACLGSNLYGQFGIGSGVYESTTLLQRKSPLPTARPSPKPTTARPSSKPTKAPVVLNAGGNETTAAELCVPNLSRTREECSDLARKCQNRFGVAMQWTVGKCDVKGEYRTVGGCRCRGFCGFPCRSVCDDEPGCRWDDAKAKCTTKATGAVYARPASC